MIKFDETSATKVAIDLAKINLEASNAWVHPEKVTDFISVVSDFLVAGKEKEA